MTTRHEATLTWPGEQLGAQGTCTCGWAGPVRFSQHKCTGRPDDADRADYVHHMQAMESSVQGDIDAHLAAIMGISEPPTAQERVTALANYVGKAYTDLDIPAALAHHIISELTLINTALRFAERDAKRLGADNATLYARANGYY